MQRTVISAAVLVVGVAGTGLSHAAKPAESGFKVTGGGQILAADAQRAGDTVGFNAQEIDGDDPASPGGDDAARGQFQYVPRGQSTNPSAPGGKFHGVVTCLLSGGEAAANEHAEDDGAFHEALTEGSARFGGHVRTRNGGTQYFTVDVTDNGQGGKASGDDMILVRFTSAPCADNPEDEENDAEELLRLGRGNVTIHNNPDSAS